MREDRWGRNHKLEEDVATEEADDKADDKAETEE